jgi:trimeric autotransporter adhesin
MKKSLIIIIALVCIVAVWAVEKLNIYKLDKTVSSYNVTELDSLTFVNSNSILRVYKSDLTQADFAVTEIDSINFSGTPDTVFVNYSGSAATVTNQLSGHGIEVTVNNADVSVQSTLDNNEVCYVLSGSSTDGSFKVYSSYKLELVLKGLTLQNSDGPAINIQSGKKATITLASATSNSLTDGATYSTSTEDQKATLFSEGQLIFKGSGALNVKSNAAHAICSDDYIEIEGGIISVTASAKDGIHTNGHFNLESGTLNILATGDAVDCETGRINISGGSLISTVATADAKGLKCDSTFTMSGGYVQLTVSGNQAKGIKSVGAMNFSGGEVKINTSGAAVLVSSGSGYDASYCTAIKGENDINVSGTKITITATGLGAKGISSDAAINIAGGDLTITTSGGGSTFKNASNVTDSYSATCISADKNITILTGTVTTTSSGSGGKGIVATGTITIGDTNNAPTLSLKTSGAKFTVSGSGNSADYNHPKTLKSDGALTINNGIISINSTDDGIKSEVSITINGGTTTISNSTEGIESKIITMNGGNVYVTASDDGINGTASTQAGGTESNDGSYFYMKGGIMTAFATSGDAVDCNGNLSMTGGTLVAFGPNNTTNEDVDANGTLLINGGLLFGGCMKSNMFESISSTTQVGANLKGSSAIATASGFLQIKDGSGTVIGTFKTPYAYYYFHVSSPSMKISTAYSIYTGGTYTGGSTIGGYCTGGTYSGGTLKKSFTTGTSKVSTLTL